MIGKAIGLGVVLAGLTGGLVWFGPQLADDVDLGSVKAPVVKTPDVQVPGVQIPGVKSADAVVPKAPKVSSAVTDTLDVKTPVVKAPVVEPPVVEKGDVKSSDMKRPEVKVGTSKTVESNVTSTRTVISDKAEVSPTAEIAQSTPPAKVDTDAEPDEKKWLDQYLKRNSDDGATNATDSDASDTDVNDAKPAVEMSDADDSNAASTDRGVVEMDEISAAISDGSEGRATNSFVVTTGTTRMGRKMTTYNAALSQAKALSVVDMRDSAYLEIFDFAVDNEDFDVATDTLAKLSSEELRDTARARMGVAHANAGRTDDAFAVLETLEIDELSDPIRLQIIAALMRTRAEIKNDR